jgi:hypothetical protein
LKKIGATVLLFAFLLGCINIVAAQRPNIFKLTGEKLKAGEESYFTVRLENPKPVRKISVVLDSDSDDVWFTLQCKARQCTSEDVLEDEESLYILNPPKGDFHIEIKNEGKKKAWYEFTVKVEY